jgi:hypothetical protein
MASTDGSFSGTLYSMPAVGATKTTTTQSLVSGNAAGNPAFQMPELGALWPVSQMAGKVLQILAGGTYDAGAVTNTMVLAYDSTQGSIGTTIASTGAATVVSTATGEWQMELTMTCTGAASATNSNWMTTGTISYGVGNNAAASAASVFMLGGANSAGVPTALSLPNYANNYWELWSTFGTAPTAFVCSQFMVLALN